MKNTLRSHLDYKFVWLGSERDYNRNEKHISVSVWFSLCIVLVMKWFSKQNECAVDRQCILLVVYWALLQAADLLDRGV